MTPQVPLMFRLCQTIAEATLPDESFSAQADLRNLLVDTFINDHDTYYRALLKYFPEECI